MNAWTKSSWYFHFYQNSGGWAGVVGEKSHKVVRQRLILLEISQSEGRDEIYLFLSLPALCNLTVGKCCSYVMGDDDDDHVMVVSAGR